MNSKEVVRRTLEFKGTERLPYDFPEKYGTDFHFVALSPSPHAHPPNGVDEWGSVWENIGVCKLGQVKEVPLKSWDDFHKLNIPDIYESRRWQSLERIREKAGDKFLVGHGVPIYARVLYLRGFENTWMDIYDEPEKLKKLIDILVEMNLVIIERLANAGADGFFSGDDWGLQDSLMIDPKKWRELWKPAYARMYQAAHKRGLFTFLHSCGYISDILDDLVEIGLDAVHMDQQENMGLKTLGDKFRGRLTFFAPVDIQETMARGDHDEIRHYCHAMVKHLGHPKGGFIPRWYNDLLGAGHSQEAVEVMCEEFLEISNEQYPRAL